VTDRGRGVRLYLWMTYFKIIDICEFPGSLIDDFKCSCRVTLLKNGRVLRGSCYFIIIMATIQIEFKFVFGGNKL
jgi:hypothetical protein